MPCRRSSSPFPPATAQRACRPSRCARSAACRWWCAWRNARCRRVPARWWWRWTIARIADALAGQGVDVCMTRADHASGSDRLAECAAHYGWPDDTIVVNLQGDEPFAPAAGIRAVAQALAERRRADGDPGHADHRREELFDPNVVKLVRTASGRALYFSRAPLPWARDAFAADREALPAGVAVPAPYRHLRLPRRVPRALCRLAAHAAGAGRVAGAVARAGTWLRHCRAADAGAVSAGHRHRGRPASAPSSGCEHGPEPPVR